MFRNIQILCCCTPQTSKKRRATTGLGTSFVKSASASMLMESMWTLTHRPRRIKVHVTETMVQKCYDHLQQACRKLTQVRGERNASSAKRSTGLCARCPRGHVSDAGRFTTLSVNGLQTRHMQSSKTRQPRQTLLSPRGRRDAWQRQ